MRLNVTVKLAFGQMGLISNFIAFASILVCISSYYVVPGPLVRATKGEVWPKPQHQETDTGYMVVRPQLFQFRATKESCKLLKKAFDRYLKIIINSTNERGSKRARANPAPIVKTWRDDADFAGYLNILEVELTEPCQDNQIPDAQMHERYSLDINKPNAGKGILKSKSIWGILRGMETFSQLLYLADDGIALIVNTTIIRDHPRFAHRGLLLDTGRHFLPMFTILQVIDAMAYNKLNVFHWHIVDDQSFPYKSVSFPQLSEKGAYNPELLIYKPEEVQKVIRHASRRGIRVMVEFDTPGHTRSWGEGIPELLTECYTNNKPNGYLGPMDPTKNYTYTFLKQFFSEIVRVFPEKYIHLGGDEVDFDCWESNPEINIWMKNNNIDGDYVKLEEHYIQNLVDIVDDLNANSIVWEEVYANGVSLPTETIVHVWKDGREVLSNATKDGLRTIWSSCWYLDHLETGGDWTKYYRCDPHTYFHLTPQQETLVIGGEACMWGETVDATNVVQRIFPRASAAAEKLWSSRNVNNINEAARRLEEHACRMNIRGIPAQPPNGPGFCL